MGIFHPCKASSHAIASVYRPFTILDILDCKENAQTNVSVSETVHNDSNVITQFDRYVVPADKSFWFRWMFFKLKKVCQAKVSKSSKISLVDQVFCVSRMKNALNAWAKGMIVIRSETAFLLSRWRLFCLAIRMRKMRHKMKREVLRANCIAVTKRGFAKWANIVKNALSYVVTANNSHKMNGSLSLLFLAFYIWTEQRAHAILVSVFMTWSQRARKRITWAVFLQMHSALSQRKLMRSVFAAWRQPAQASFLPMADAEIVAMYILSHRHDSQRINVTHGNCAFKAVSQQISDVRNITFARANEAMQTCPFESADKLCIQLSSSSWLQQMKSIISVKPSGSICHLSSSKVPFRNLNDVFVACEDVLDPSFVSRVLLQPRQTFSKAKDVSECNWGKCVLSAASRKSEYAQSAAALAWADLVYLTSVTSNSCLHENSLRQHLTKVEMAAAVKESSEKMIFKSKHSGEDVVSRCLQLTGMRMWLSSVAGGWNTMSALVPLTRNISAIWDLRLKERRALILRDNLIIISGKVKDESSIFAALFKTKKAKKKVMKKKPGKKKKSDKLSTSGAASDNDSIGTAGSPSPVSKNSGFPQFQASDSVIKMPDQNMTMIQRLTNMVHSSDEQISSFTLSETVSEAMEPDSELFDQQLHNRYVAIANDFDVSNAALQLQYSSDSDDDTPVLQGFDSDEEEVVAKAPTAHAPLQAISQMIDADLAPEEEGSEKTAITLVASAGPDFHVSLAMKQFIAPKPIRVPRVALPVSLLAIARDLALQLSDKYDSAQADLHSRILEAVAHKPAHPQSDESSEVDDDLEENVDPLVSSPTASAVNQDPGTHFVISSANEMVVCSDLAGVTVKSQSLNTPNILFDMEGDLEISKDDLKYLNGSNLTAPELGTSFSALEAKFVNPFSTQAKGKPFQHWDAHDEAGGLKPDDTMPVLLAIPQAKVSKQPKTQKLKPDTAVSHSAASPSSLTVVSSPAALHNIPHAVQELDFSLPDVPDVVKDRQSHSNALGAFPPATSPSKQNRYKAPPDRVRELLDTVNPPSAKDVQLQSESQPTIAEAPAVDSKSSEDVAKLRKQFSEMGQKNAQKLKHSHSESANAAKALTQSDEASNRRKLLLHEATESAYDALDLMAPHLKAIFEENFDSLINRVVDANAKNHGSTDRHIWHELNLQRNAELQDASKGSLVADSDDHIKRVFQSRQNYRAMMAKSESFQGRAEGEPNHGQESLLKSRPSVELDRELQSNIKASKSTMNTFSSGNRDFVTGLAKSVSAAALKAPFLSSPQPYLPNQAETDFAHVSQMQLSRSFNKAHIGRGTVEPFSATQTFNVHSTPRENSLVPAPQFVIIDSSTLAPAQQLEITGSEIPEMSNSDSAEAAFLKAKNTRLALSKPGTSNPAFKTQSDRILKPAVQSAGLPIVGGTSLGISVSKNQSLPRLESTIASIGLASEKSAAPTSATVSEQAAISNVQGLICAKSIFKAAPQSVPRKPPRAQFSASSSDRFAGTRDLQTATSQKISDANIADSAVVLTPKALNSTQILGLHDIQPASLFDEADSEVDRYLSTAPSLSVSGGLSPSMSPHPSSPPIVMAHFTASQAATDFNQFLDSLSIDDALNKSLASNAAKPTQSRHVAHADAEHSSRHAQSAEQVTAVVAPPRGAKSYDIDSAPPSSGVVADLQGFRHEAPAKKPFEAAQASGSFAADRVHATGVTATSPTVPAVAHQTSVTPNISAASVRALPAVRHAVSTSVSILMPSVDRLSPVSDNVVKSSGVAPPPSATATLAVLPLGSHQLAADFTQDSAVSPPVSLSSKEHVAASDASQDPAGAEDALKPSATFESVADPVFEFHASAAPLNDLATSDAPVSSLSTSPLNDVSLPTSQPPSAAISATPQVPHTTPHASQVAPVSQPIKSSPLIAQKPGVQGSAIRSFLLNIQGKAASDSVSGNMSPQEIIYQQRASAVELIRQRSMMNPDSRRKPPDIAAEHPVSSTSRRQTLDRVDGSDDSSDEELRAGYIFKNQKIVSVVFFNSSKCFSLTISSRNHCKPTCLHYRENSMLCVPCKYIALCCLQQAL
jgi:hypothetical protein